MKQAIFLVITILGVLSVQAEVLFEEDFSSGYVRGALVGQGDWVEKSGKSSPRVYDYGVDGWAVVGKKTSEDAWAFLNVGSLGLKPSDTLVVEVTLLRGVPKSKEGSAVLVGVGKSGSKMMPAAIGASNDGVFVRGGRSPVSYAVKPDGTQWGNRQNDPQDYREHYEKIVLRSEWNLINGIGTLAVKNLTLGETEFTPLFFDQAQSLETAQIGNVWEIEEWDQILIRIGGSAAARVYSVKVSR